MPMTEPTGRSWRRAEHRASFAITVLSETTHCSLWVWESEELMRTRFSSDGMRRALAEAGFPPMDTAEITVLRLHAVEPPL